jgi:hypothetical protein
MLYASTVTASCQLHARWYPPTSRTDVSELPHVLAAQTQPQPLYPP